MDKRDELVVTAPVQIKRALSPGNIYDFIIADFYTKSRRLMGIKASMPLFWNVNGLPALKMMKEEGMEINETHRKSFVEECIRNGEISLKKYCIEFTSQLRDDRIGDRLSKFINENCLDSLHKGILPIAVCSMCGFDFGTDSSISICKLCGNPVFMKDLEVMYQNISRNKISDRIDQINIYPDGAKKELDSFNIQMPYSYDICLTKRREYTLSYDGYSLDPRFIVMITPALIDGDYSKRTYIHGDIIKKFSYYSICHLPHTFLPASIICHGVLLDGFGRKIRWQNLDLEQKRMFDALPAGELRAFILKRNVAKDVLIDFNSIKRSLQAQKLLRNRLDRLMSSDSSSSVCSEEFLRLKAEFFEATSSFLYGVAYDKMLLIVRLLERKLSMQIESICTDEKLFLNELRFLYFGKYYGAKD